MTQPNQSELTPEFLARMFHDTYELVAPRYDYVTRKETRQFDPTSPNGRTMIATCAGIIAYITANYTPNTKLKALIEASEKLNLEFHGRPDCKNCSLQEQLAELIKDNKL